MKKISTLYKKDPNNLGRVIDEVDPKNQWVFECGVPTRKFDGTSCAIINGDLYKRFELKPGRVLPPNAIPCQNPDEITGKQPFWVKCERDDKSNKYHFEAYDKLKFKNNCSYELCGEKINKNMEGIDGHVLILHGSVRELIFDFSYEGIKEYLEDHNIEGIVFHHPSDDRMCKIRKRDFGLKRRQYEK